MNSKFALATVALLASVSFAHTAAAAEKDDWIMISGNYTEPTGGKASIEPCKPAPNYCFSLRSSSTPGQWYLGAITRGGKLEGFQFQTGPFKGGEYRIVYGDAETVKLVEVGGNKTTWTLVR